MAGEILTKRVAISKANAQMVAIVGVAAFIVIFCLVAANTIFSQTNYQNRVLGAMNKTKKQLINNIQTYNQLSSAYNKFDKADPNIIGGSASGGGTNGGNNAQIILDALPPTYDFPALTASLEKMLGTGSFKVGSISGTDDEVNQQSNIASPRPQAVSLPFSFTVNNANYASITQLISTLEKSIRPMQIDTMNLNGSSNNMSLTVSAHTYYQPGKSVNVTQKVIK